MASRNKFFADNYDKLLFAASVVLLAVSGFFAFVKGPSDAKSESDSFRADLRKLESGRQKKLAEASPFVFGAALHATEEPFRMNGTNVAFLVAPERVWCVSCRRPITIAADVCPSCGAEQPSDVVGEDWDTDGDGMPDAWEKKFGLNQLDAADADGDLDKDGFTNREEFDAGTDPRDPKSHPPRFRFLRVARIDATPFPYLMRGKMRLPDGKFTFQINGPRNITHSVKQGDELDKTGFVLDSYTTRKGILRRKGLPDKETDLYVLKFKRGPDEVELLEGRAEAVSTAFEVAFICEKDREPKEYVAKRNETFDFDGEKFTLLDVRRADSAAAVRRESTGETIQIPSK